MHTRKDLNFAPNLENLVKAVNRIIENPSEWNQTTWHCGSAHCLFGWGQILSGKRAEGVYARLDASNFFGLTEHLTDIDWLSHPNRKIVDFIDYINFFKTDTPDRDRFGFDAAGYNRNGYARDGYDRAGFDHKGFDRNGYDRDGYDRDGYDRNLKDRNGIKLPLLTV